MRIWDLNPGYLDRQRLLGEHRELHGIVSVLVNGKKGYSRHPETLRWKGYGWALKVRHQLLATEMALRGYREQTPVNTRAKKDEWPEDYIDTPFAQLRLLREKYQDNSQGRIILPNNVQQLWAQHKYSVMARDLGLYRKLGKDVATMRGQENFARLAELLTTILRQVPSPGGLHNALQHMWGYVSGLEPVAGEQVQGWSPPRLLQEIQQRAVEANEPYLLASTALSELGVWARYR
jgi:hypothetical protein